MKITDVRLRAVKGENELKLKAYADVTFDGMFCNPRVKNY